MTSTLRRHRRAQQIVRWLGGFAVASVLVPAAAWAAAPLNDNYLASTQMMRSDGTVTREFHEVVDTSAATVQPDLFDPDKEGMKLGGGPAENIRCGQSEFGATVWYDFAPEVAGGVEIVAGGYDTVVSVYEYDVRTAKITRAVTCANRPGAGEDVLVPKVKRGAHYTIQVGGAGATAGMLDFKFSFYGDRDEDDVLDLSDKCPRIPGVSEAGGCPPELRVAPRVGWTTAAGGARLERLSVLSVPVGARVEARCRRCGLRQVRVAHGPVVSLPQFVGRLLPDGAALELLVTRAHTSAGRYRFGAVGNYFRYTVRNGRLSARTDRCLQPGSTTPRRRCS
jgi:hypothetical protein